MGFIKRNIELEEYLDSLNVEWECLSDSEYKVVLKELDGFVKSGDFYLSHGDDAFGKIEEKMPFSGFVFSAPKHKYFSIYDEGGDNLTFGYKVKGIRELDRETVNKIECVISNESLSFACVFSHEWQAQIPEQFYEKNA